jgi:heterotetrameric sarcosine oxidase gamma subunit
MIQKGRESVVDLAERTSALAAIYETGTFGADVEGGPSVTLSERRPLSIVHVAGDAGDAAFADGVKSACGCALPTTPGDIATSGDLSLIWLAPERWLAVAPDRGPGALEAAFRKACGDSIAIIDVSHGRTVIRLSGANARTVLMKGAPLDFHKKVFTPGRAAQSAISQCGTLITCPAEDTFDVYVFRAFGQHMWEWLTDASGEFGYTIESAANQT